MRANAAQAYHGRPGLSIARGGENVEEVINGARSASSFIAAQQVSFVDAHHSGLTQRPALQPPRSGAAPAGMTRLNHRRLRGQGTTV
jgi:hypothetical protein